MTVQPLAAIPEPAPADGPRPIDPADVREGDRVRMVVAREGVVHQDGCLVIDSGEHFGLRKQGATLYLLDRPDPDAERVGRLRDALIAVTGQPLRYLGSIGVDEIRAALKAAGLSIEPRPTGGDLHA